MTKGGKGIVKGQAKVRFPLLNTTGPKKIHLHQGYLPLLQKAAPLSPNKEAHEQSVAQPHLNMPGQTLYAFLLNWLSFLPGKPATLYQPASLLIRCSHKTALASGTSIELCVHFRPILVKASHLVPSLLLTPSLLVRCRGLSGGF